MYIASQLIDLNKHARWDPDPACFEEMLYMYKGYTNFSD